MLLLPTWEGLRAAQVPRLYQAEVPVAGQSAEQRNSAIREAFTRVLLKVSGNRGVADRKQLAEVIQNAPRYVQQYSYLGVPAGDAGMGGEAPGSEPSRLLQVSFDSRAVDQLLREQGIPVWGANRPSILVWMGVEAKGKRQLLPLEQGEPVRAALERAAGMRGLPLLFPLMDLEDRGGMQISDLWGGFEANVREASRRYGPDLILVGRMARVSRSLWRGTWTLYQREQHSSWSSEAKSGTTLAAGAVQHVADLLASRFVPLGGGSSSSRLKLRVVGVDNLEKYVAIRGLLDSQSSVTQVLVDVVDPFTVTFALQTRGSIQSLEQGLELGGLIEPETDIGFADPTAGGAAGPPEQKESSARKIDLSYRMRQ
jgi:hypothetical protein